MSDGQMAAVLWGTDHEELGEIESRSVGERIGLAITRGLHKKAYRYEDPNEDVVAAVDGPAATLLVVADGHNGALAPVTAVQAVLDALGPAPPADLADGEWLDLFRSVNDTVIARKGPGSPQPASNTVLIAALVSPGGLSFGAMGDAALVVARPGNERARQLNKEEMRFVGYPMSKRAIKSTVQRGRFDLEADHWVVLVTDGLSEFIAPLRPADLVPRILATADGAEGAARALIDTACIAGAGDNVAAAVLAPH